MVNLEELLAKVQQAETETDRQWVLLELQMGQMSPELVSMLWAAAITHFFDAQVLAALRPELAEQAEGLYAALQQLTFVEEFAGRGFNVHELTRATLLNKLWAKDKAEFLLLSQRAADYFFEFGTSVEEEIEACYHEVLNEGEAQTGRLLEHLSDWWRDYKIEHIQSVAKRIEEHNESQRLDEFGLPILMYLNGLSEMFFVNYKSAEKILEEVNEIFLASKFKNSRYSASMLRDLSNSRYAQGLYKDAEQPSLQALEICEEQLVANHPDTAISLNNLASIYHETGRYEKAESLYSRALKIFKEQLEENHLYTASILNNLASVYHGTGRCEKAKTLYLRSLKVREEQLGENHPDTANSLNNLASLYDDTGRHEEADFLYLRSLKIREEQLGENHPDTANILNNLASLYNDTGRYKEAEPLYLRALKIREEKLGINHPDTARTLSNLATLYQKQERYQEAVPLLERHIVIKRNRDETQNVDFAIQTQRLGKLYEKCQQFPEAIATYEEALKLYRQQFGNKHQRTMVLQGELNRLKRRVKQQKKQQA